MRGFLIGVIVAALLGWSPAATAQTASGDTYAGAWAVGPSTFPGATVVGNTITLQLDANRLTGRFVLRIGDKGQGGDLSTFTIGLCILLQLDLDGSELTLVEHSADGKAGFAGEVTFGLGGGDPDKVNCATVGLSGQTVSGQMKVTVDTDGTLNGGVDQIPGFDATLRFSARRTTTGSGGAAGPANQPGDAVDTLDGQLDNIGFGSRAGSARDQLRAYFDGEGLSLDNLAKGYDAARRKLTSSVPANDRDTAEAASVLATALALVQLTPTDGRTSSQSPFPTVFASFRVMQAVLGSAPNVDPATTALLAEILREAIAIDVAR
jgi:hypothetical protein